MTRKLRLIIVLWLKVYIYLGVYVRGCMICGLNEKVKYAKILKLNHIPKNKLLSLEDEG